MKKPNLLALLPQMLLTFLIGLSGMGCLATAFDLPISAGPILLACVFFAVLTAIIPEIRHGWLITLAAMALWGLYFWKKDVIESLLYLAKNLLQIYRMAYGFSLPGFISAAKPADMTLAVTLIAAVCTLLAGLGLASGKAASVVCALLLPVVPCFVVIDTVPAEGWLLALLLCLVLVLMSQNVRNIDPRRAGRVVAFLLLPVLLAGWLLLHYNPKDSYQRPSQEENFGDRLLEYVDKLPYLEAKDGQIQLDFDEVPYFTFPPQTMPPITGGPGDLTLPPVTLDPGIIDIFKDSVSLGNAGPRDPGQTVVMQIKTSYRGTVYLRERGYDIYTGGAWESSGEAQWLSIEKKFLDYKSRTVTVTTKWTHSNYFVPYYSLLEEASLKDGKMPNPDELREYTFSMCTLSDAWRGLWKDSHGITLGQMNETMNTQLPESTLAGARQILETIGIQEDMLVVEAAQKIRNFVRDSAVYDLDTEKMPEEYQDFALWFLQESETGYCVHFATATTVLLRAAGIPARYVEGYMVSANGTTADVLASDAHAWVEYYVPGAGWILLEATPGNGGTPIPPVTTGPTEPPTTLPTEPTTTVPTQPETTVPSTPPTTLPILPTDPTPPTSTPATDPSTSAPTTAPTTTLPGTSSVPPATEPVPPPEPKDLTGLWTALAIVFGVLSVGCGLYGQWQLRLWLKREWLSRGASNRRAIKLWRESRMYAYLRRQKVPQTLRDLAWKAKFSQHIITDEELNAFIAYHQRSIAHLKTRPWYLKVVYRLVFAAY